MDWNQPLTSRHVVVGKGATVRAEIGLKSAKVRDLPSDTVVVAAERRTADGRERVRVVEPCRGWISAKCLAAAAAAAPKKAAAAAEPETKTTTKAAAAAAAPLDADMAHVLVLRLRCMGKGDPGARASDAEVASVFAGNARRVYSL